MLYFSVSAMPSPQWVNQKPINYLCPYLSVMNKRHYLGLKRIQELFKLVLISGVKTCTTINKINDIVLRVFYCRNGINITQTYCWLLNTVLNVLLLVFIQHNVAIITDWDYLHRLCSQWTNLCITWSRSVHL